MWILWKGAAGISREGKLGSRRLWEHRSEEACLRTLTVNLTVSLCCGVDGGGVALYLTFTRLWRGVALYFDLSENLEGVALYFDLDEALEGCMCEP